MIGGGYNVFEYFLLTMAGENPYSVHLWYLLTLFLIKLTCYIFSKISYRLHYNEIVVLFILAFLLWNIRIIFGETFCMTAKSYLKYTIFFVFGMILYKNRKGFPVKLYIPLSILSWFYIAIYSADMITTTVFAFKYLKNIFVLISCLTVIMNFFDIARKSHVFCGRKMKYLGKNSMVFYLFHQPFCAMFGLVLYEKIGLPGYIVCIACFAGSLILPQLVILISRKSQTVRSALTALFDIKV